jgi:hypothetical protein
MWFSDTAVCLEIIKSLDRARIKGKTNQFHEYNRNCFDFFSPSIIFSGLLAWNQIAEAMLPSENSFTRYSCVFKAVSLKSTCWFFFLTFEIVLNATGKASNHWQPINVPSHALADYRVMMAPWSSRARKAERAQGLIFKGKIRTEQDKFDTTVSEDPQKAILAPFGWFWKSAMTSSLLIYSMRCLGIWWMTGFWCMSFRKTDHAGKGLYYILNNVIGLIFIVLAF